MTNFPTSDTEIRALKVRVLRALGTAAHPKEAIGLVASNHKLTVDDVRSLVAPHGYPDPKEMRRHAFELDTNGSVPPTRPAPSAVPQQPVQALIIERLLGAGEKSAKARTRNLAKKIRGSVAELHGLVVAERKEAEAANAAAEERVRLKAEVDELERPTGGEEGEASADGCREEGHGRTEEQSLRDPRVGCHAQRRLSRVRPRPR